jgi:hypothetical protein
MHGDGFDHFRANLVLSVAATALAVYLLMVAG